MNNLNQDAITKIPHFYGRGSKELYTLEEAKVITEEYFRAEYDFNTKLKQYIYNLDNCKTLFSVQNYVINAALKGFKLKAKIKMSKIYKDNK